MSRCQNDPTARAIRGEVRGTSAGDRPRDYRDPWCALTDFTNAIAAAGLGRPDVIADGSLHRFRAEGDKAGDKNAWYVLYRDGIPAGAFGSWKTGVSERWCARQDHELTPRERAMVKALMKQAQHKRELERAHAQQVSAKKAQHIWSHAPPAPENHPYLVRKGIRPHHARIDRHDNLVLSVSDGEQLTSLQLISADGSKQFLSGGRIRGCFSYIQGCHADTSGPTLIAEGFATAATLYEAMGFPVVIAFNAGNLMAIAELVRAKLPNEEIYIAGDNDQWTDGNPGATKARAAAEAIGAKLLLPEFTGLDTSGRPTDWNDWYALRPPTSSEVAR